MKQTKSCKKEKLEKKQDKQQSLDLDEAMIRRLYIGSDSGSS
jgi:hypothetical protein